jgi:hypothetical protein
LNKANVFFPRDPAYRLMQLNKIKASSVDYPYNEERHTNLEIAHKDTREVLSAICTPQIMSKRLTVNPMTTDDKEVQVVNVGIQATI